MYRVIYDNKNNYYYPEKLVKFLFLSYFKRFKIDDGCGVYNVAYTTKDQAIEFIENEIDNEKWLQEYDSIKNINETVWTSYKNDGEKK